MSLSLTTNKRPRRIFFLSVETWVFVDVNQLFPLFSHTLWQSKVLSSLNERRRLSRLSRIISNDDGVLNDFIKMKDYVVKTTRSLRAEWNSRNTLYRLRKGFQVVCLFDCMKNKGAVDEMPRTRNSKKRKISYRQWKKFSVNGGCFRKWIIFVTCRSTYHSSCYRIESRTSRNSDVLQACVDLDTVFDAVFRSRQMCENLMSNNFHKTAVLKKTWIVN